MRRNAAAVIIAVAVALTACTTDGPTSPAQPGEPDAGGTTAATDSVTVVPQAELEGRCEPAPQQDEDGTYLTADLVARNTGNVGVVVRVVATWRQPGGRYLTASRRLRLEVDERAPVELRIDVGPREARAVRRMVQRGRPCFTRVRVAGAFGAPRQ